jgi:hypothetical protein
MILNALKFIFSLFAETLVICNTNKMQKLASTKYNQTILQKGMSKSPQKNKGEIL